MTLDELAGLCREAARELAGREPRPLPATVLLPGQEATELITLPGFPDDDAGRAEALAALAEDRVVPRGAPCYGFLAEAELVDGTDVLLVAYGARRQGAYVTAAPLGGDALGEFSEDEALAHGALPFLAPLQRAVDQAEPPDVTRVR